MPVPFGDLYRAGHERVATLARSLPAADLDRPVPACPGWSVRDVVAHLAGLAVEALDGTLRPGPGGVPPDSETARQVRDRAGRDLEAVLAEWASRVDAVVGALDGRAMPPNIAQDVLCHEADVVEAVGASTPPQEDWLPAARWMARGVIGRLDGPGTLVVRADGDEVRGGSGDGGALASVDVGSYELFRGLFSRRSRAQVAAWDWTGDPTPWVDRIGVFGPRDDDQPRPAG